MSLLQRGMRWLTQAPVSDPLDRRNAPGFQMLLVLAALLAPLMLFAGWREAGRITPAIGTGLAASAGFWACLWLVRQGRFRLSVALVFCGLLGLILLSYQRHGLGMHAGFQVAHLLPLLLGGLLLGRKALWSGLLVLLVALFVGAGVDLARDDQPELARSGIRDGLMLSALTFLVATVMLDRLISASRRALRRSEELTLANARLAREMDEREQAQQQLLQAQKLDALGQMARGIAHDFNHILGVIVGYAGIARSRDGYDGKPIDGIENAARRGALMTRRLLGLGRHQARIVEVFEAGESARQAMTLIEPLFRGRAEVCLELPDQPLHVALDRNELELALLNLATNARDALADGGLCRIVVDSHEGMVRLAIHDSGCGMSPEVQERIFEPFFTTKPGDSGSGVGMPVVHRLVDDAGGRIEVHSAPGEGTMVALLLPVADAGSEVREALPHGFGVLLVDDDAELRGILAAALRRAGCEVVEAASGRAACALEPAFLPQALVLDYRLPDTDGLALMAALAKRWPRARRVLITSHLPDGVDPAAQGAELLRKPFRPGELLARLGA